MGKKLIIILIIIMVLAIAGVGIFTAFQLTNQPQQVATPVPTQEALPTFAPSPTPNLCLLEFTIGATATPRSLSTATPRSTASATPSGTAKASASPLALGGLPTSSPTARPSSTATTSTSSPKATATSSAIVAASPTTRPQASLPVAGVGLPTIIGIIMGLLLLIGAFFLAV